MSDDFIDKEDLNEENVPAPEESHSDYEPGIRVIEKFDANKVWSAALYDADQQGYPYLKRFTFEASARKLSFLGENKQSQLILLTDVVYPRIGVTFGGNDVFREALDIDVEEFIGVKSYKAKGKRITTFAVESIVELEPTRFPEETEAEEPTDEEPINEDPDNGKSESDIIDEITGQMKLF